MIDMILQEISLQRQRMNELTVSRNKLDNENNKRIEDLKNSHQRDKCSHQYRGRILRSRGSERRQQRSSKLTEDEEADLDHRDTQRVPSRINNDDQPNTQASANTSDVIRIIETLRDKNDIGVEEFIRSTKNS